VTGHERAHRGPDVSGVVAPRSVSVLFTDVVGSTELFGSIGDIAADALRRDHVGNLRAVVDEHGGQYVKGLGDGIMAVFDSGAAAAEAGLAMQRSTDEFAARRAVPLVVRVGVAAGDASTDGDDWFGTPVVEASRLCASAAPGQVLVSDLVRRLAGSRTALGFRSLGTRALKGLPELVLVHEVQSTAGSLEGAATARGQPKSGSLRPSRFGLLGRFVVESDGRPIADGDLGNRKARLLLKLLAVRHGRHVPMDTIIEALWSDAPAKAVENVATLVSRLRTTLGSDVIDGGRAGYRLEIPPGCTVDADDAERLVDEAEARLDAGQPALAATAAAQALGVLGAGTPLEDETAGGEWLDEFRRELERLVRRARVAGWRASAGIGEHRRALGLAEQAVGADALDEEAHRAVITAYHRLGEPGEALAAYERVRTVLVEELGADPSAETQDLYLAVLRGEVVADADRVEHARDARSGLVGREEELAGLVRCWDEASRGAPSCVLLIGETGIGKSRLVEELARDVRATGASAVTARCYESEESLFLQPMVEVLRELVTTLPSELITEAAGPSAGPLANLVPELGRVMGPVIYERATPEMERRRTFEAVASFLASLSRRRPLLVILDDVHNASVSTVELVHFVLRWDRSAHILIAATVESDRRAQVEAQLGERATTVRLGPLSEDAVGVLARDAGHPGIVTELMRLTKGHTVFVLEALKAVAEGGRGIVIPDSLRSAVTARVGRCGPDVEEFLRGAVVAGSVFDVEHVAELLGLSGEEAVRRAETALRVGLVVEAGIGYEFANDVIRKVLYDTTPAPTRAVRHRRLAALLRSRPEAAAEHAAAAGDWEPAVDHWLEAAASSLAAFANREAEGLLTRAFDACALLADPSRTARVQLLRGRARLQQAHYDGAAQDLAAVQALARATGDSSLEAAALEELAWCAYYARQLDRASELAERALQHPSAGAGAQVLAGRLRNTRGNLAGAIEILQPVVDDAQDPIVRASALSYLGTALAHSERFEDAITVLDEAVGSCRVAGLLRPMFNAGFFASMARANLGDLEGALHAATLMAADVERYDNEAYRSRCCNLLSWLWRELGDPARALDLAHEALEATILSDGYVEAEPAAHARLQLAESALLAGDDAGAAQWLGHLSDAGLASVAFGWRIGLHRLELAARLDPTEGEALLAGATRYGSAKYRALALAHLGRHDEAVAVASTTKSDLLVAHVAPTPMAVQAADRVAARLSVEHRAGFLARGQWQVVAARISENRRRR
jgi:class 3 adenylate cyclase/DNA-binding SARP family transcriptional activator/tetratricopeptide (TPR) repeat protein